MEKNDWYEVGEQIKKLVQDAVDSKDFTQLGSTISSVVNDAVDGLQSSIRENLGQAGQTSGGPGGSGGRKPGAAGGSGGSGSRGPGASGGSGGSGSRKAETFWEAGSAGDGYSGRRAAEEIRRSLREKDRSSHVSREQPSRVPAVRQEAPGTLFGSVMKWVGYGLGTILGVTAMLLGIISVTMGIPLLLPMGILMLMAGVNFCVGSYGSGRLDMARRFRRYQEIIAGRTHCLIGDLASAVGKSKRFVRKDLRRMIERGYFAEAYLDRKGQTLITDKATYQQYLDTQAEFDRRKTEVGNGSGSGAEDGDARTPGSGAKDEDARKETRALSPECRELIAEGEKYIRHVHECNEKIEDADMSAKLDRLELVITRIFYETKRNPEAADDLKKMMSYYLPTTRKLLDAYCEMNEQPIRGQNIENMQKEIENALDTINEAFENLLDSFFEDKAWDISSDITVLNTMLAQEGLTGKDFETGQGGKKNEQ